jgi:hypothetical protein
MKQTRPGKRKSKSMPDQKKSKKKGPYGPFFFIHMTIHLPNIEATFQHETHCSNIERIVPTCQSIVPM